MKVVRSRARSIIYYSGRSGERSEVVRSRFFISIVYIQLTHTDYI